MRSAFVSIIFVCLYASAALASAKNCPGILAGKIKLNRSIRTWGDAIPIRQEWMLPQQILVLTDEPMYMNDRLAIAMAENKDYIEVGYYEALDARGSVILTSDFVDGNHDSVNSKDALFSFLFELDQRYPYRQRGRIRKIRMVHTHPPHFTRDFFSYQDVHKLLLIHAMLEVLGGTEVELEQAILYPGFAGYRRGIGDFVKRSLFIPAHSLSWINRDYLLNPSSEELMRDLRSFLNGRTGYVMPSSWFNQR